MNRRRVLYTPRFTEDLESFRDACPEIVTTVSRGPAVVLTHPGRAELFYSSPAFPDSKCLQFQPREDAAFAVVYRLEEDTVIFERLIRVPTGLG